MAPDKKSPACAECRTRKLKCVASQGQLDSCQRCARLDRKCYVPASKPRGERKAKLRGRVERLEGNYTEILTLLKRGVQAGSTTNPDAKDTSLSSQDHQQEDLGCSDLGQLFMQDLGEAIKSYRVLSQDFYPFVLIPEEWNSTVLYQKRPKLALAIVIATSWRSPEHQAVMQARFIKELGNTFFSDSEKSFDTLQAILVYLGWCHWFATPHKGHIYRLLRLVENLAIELGITQRPMRLTQHEVILKSATKEYSITPNISAEFGTYEARRAYIGAYFYSVFNLMTSRKPVALSYNQYLDECASSLAAAGQYYSDVFLVHHVRALHIGEQISHTFDHGSKEVVDNMSDERLQFLVQTFEKQLDDLQKALPTDFSALGVPQEVATRQISELRGFYNRCRASIYEPGLYGLLEKQVPSLVRVSMIYECFSSCMKFLSSCLETPLEQMTGWTTMDWRCLNFFVMLAFRSSLILETCRTETRESQRAASLDACLKSLSRRAEELQLLVQGPLRQESYLRKLSSDWTYIKVCHEVSMQKKFARQIESTAIDGTTVQGSEYADNYFNAEMLNSFLYGTYETTESFLSTYTFT
ncbi:hypothetical protein V8C35DRAFT_293977 [Trichoderma chlorosporum]